MWNAVPTARNTLHVMNTETLESFEAASEAEMHEVLDELDKRKAEEEAAKAAAVDTSGEVALPVTGSVGAVDRSN